MLATLFWGESSAWTRGCPQRHLNFRRYSIQGLVGTGDAEHHVCTCTRDCWKEKGELGSIRDPREESPCWHGRFVLWVLVLSGAETWAWVANGSWQVVQGPRLEGPGCSCRFWVERGGIFQTFGLGLVPVWAESTSPRTGNVTELGYVNGRPGPVSGQDLSVAWEIGMWPETANGFQDPAST